MNALPEKRFANATPKDGASFAQQREANFSKHDQMIKQLQTADARRRLERACDVALGECKTYFCTFAVPRRGSQGPHLFLVRNGCKLQWLVSVSGDQISSHGLAGFSGGRAVARSLSQSRL